MTVKVNVDVGKALENLGLSTAPLTDKGVTFVAFTGGAKFVLNGEVIASWAAAPAKIAEVAQLGYDDAKLAHQTLKGNADSAYQAALAAVAGGAVKAPATGGTVGAAVGHSLGGGTIKAPATEVDHFPIAQMKTADLVPLSTATKVYQPVKGSSAGSRYYAVGVSPGLKVAARIKPKNLSIRVEGQSFAGAQPKLVAAGIFGPEFAGQFNDNYASMHVEIASLIDAQKVVGAVLGVLCDYIKHPVPDLKPLEAA